MVYKRKERPTHTQSSDDDLDAEDRAALAAFNDEGFDATLTTEEATRSEALEEEVARKLQEEKEAEEKKRAKEKKRLEKKKKKAEEDASKAPAWTTSGPDHLKTSFMPDFDINNGLNANKST